MQSLPFPLRAVALAVALTAVGCAKKKLPDATRSVLSSATTLNLMSLDPTPTSTAGDGTFHGYPISKQITVTDPKQREAIASAIVDGVNSSGDEVAACFNPRHGLRIMNAGKQHDFVICFECFQIRHYVGSDLQKGLPVTAKPQAVFDRVLATQ